MYRNEMHKNPTALDTYGVSEIAVEILFVVGARTAVNVTLLSADHITVHVHTVCNVM